MIIFQTLQHNSTMETRKLTHRHTHTQIRFHKALIHTLTLTPLEKDGEEQYNNVNEIVKLTFFWFVFSFLFSFQIKKTKSTSYTHTDS